MKMILHVGKLYNFKTHIWIILIYLMNYRIVSAASQILNQKLLCLAWLFNGSHIFCLDGGGDRIPCK